MEALKNLKLMKHHLIGQYGIHDLDLSKITISVKDTTISGHRLHELLRVNYHIVLEMEASDLLFHIA